MMSRRRLVDACALRAFDLAEYVAVPRAVRHCDSRRLAWHRHFLQHVVQHETLKENVCHGFSSTEQQVFYQFFLLDPGVAPGCGAKACKRHLAALLQRPPPREHAAESPAAPAAAAAPPTLFFDDIAGDFDLPPPLEEEERKPAVEHTDSMSHTPRRSLRSTECSSSSTSQQSEHYFDSEGSASVCGNCAERRRRCGSANGNFWRPSGLGNEADSKHEGSSGALSE